MSEYNIPALVKWFEKRPNDWNDAGKMDEYMGTVVMVKKSQYSEKFLVKDEPAGREWSFYESQLVFNPTPSQIEEEARKAGKAPVTTKPLVDPMTVNWPREAFAVGVEVVVKPQEVDNVLGMFPKLDVSKPLKFVMDDRTDCPYFEDARGLREPLLYKRLAPLSKVQEYQASKAAQEPPMPTKQPKPPKPTICEVALRAARERFDGLAKLKDTQDRIKLAKASLAKETKDRRAAIAQLEAEAATLSKKWLKGVGK